MVQELERVLVTVFVEEVEQEVLKELVTKKGSVMVQELERVLMTEMAPEESKMAIGVLLLRHWRVVRVIGWPFSILREPFRSSEGNVQIIQGSFWHHRG